MKIISGINSIRSLGGMKIKEKIGGVGQDFDRDRKYHFPAGGSQAGNMSW